MTRAIPLILALSSVALAQTQVFEAAFLRAVNTLDSREADGEKADPSLRIQDELNIPSADAEVILATVRSFVSGVAAIERELKLTIFERRMQVTAGEDISLPSESELLAQRDRQVEALVAGKMQELRTRLTAAASRNLNSYIERGALGWEFFPLREGEKRVVALRQ
jgi:hypothetical protein